MNPVLCKIRGFAFASCLGFSLTALSQTAEKQIEDETVALQQREASLKQGMIASYKKGERDQAIENIDALSVQIGAALINQASRSSP